MLIVVALVLPVLPTLLQRLPNPPPRNLLQFRKHLKLSQEAALSGVLQRNM